MKRGEYDEAKLEEHLENRGFMYRIFGKWMKTITKEWQLYPVGVVFGMGFDTAPRWPSSRPPRTWLPTATSRGMRSYAFRSFSPRA